MRIPRLCIIEIENMYNRNMKKGQGKSSEGNILDPILEYQKYKEKRISVYTIKEILNIKNEGGDIISDVDVSLIESFSRAAGSGFADHLDKKRDKRIFWIACGTSNRW